MIAVDVSFLAVPSVMPSDTTSLPPEVISTYISVFCIIGSLVVSLFLTRQNRHQESADKAVSKQWCTDKHQYRRNFAGRLPHEDDRICVWYESTRHHSWSSVCYAIVGVSILVVPEPPRLAESGCFQHGVFYACVLLPCLHVYVRCHACYRWECVWHRGFSRSVARTRREGFSYVNTADCVVPSLPFQGKAYVGAIVVSLNILLMIHVHDVICTYSNAIFYLEHLILKNLS